MSVPIKRPLDGPTNGRLLALVDKIITPVGSGVRIRIYGSLIPHPGFSISDQRKVLPWPGKGKPNKHIFVAFPELHSLQGSLNPVRRCAKGIYKTRFSSTNRTHFTTKALHRKCKLPRQWFTEQLVRSSGKRIFSIRQLVLLVRKNAKDIPSEKPSELPGPISSDLNEAPCFTSTKFCHRRTLGRSLWC